MKWTFFYCGNIIFLWKTSMTSSWRTKPLFPILFPLISLSCVKYHNLHTFLHLNGINPWIEYLDIFWYIWYSILSREQRNKWSSCFYYSKSGTVVLGQSSQHFKIQSHFENFDPVIEDRNDTMKQHHSLLDLCVNCLEIFYSCIQCNLS